MKPADHDLNQLAVVRLGLITRADVIGVGTDRLTDVRLDRGQWTRLHAGVYQAGVAPLDWRGQLHAATLAAGDGAQASHRAAWVLWGLDGIGSAPLELLVPITHGPVPAGVIVHRTRRPPPASVVDGIPVTPIDRTILDGFGCLPALVAEKGMESAFRRHLTTPTKLGLYLVEAGGRGVRGSGLLRELLGIRTPGRAAGSPAEVELLHHLRLADAPEPVRQHVVELPDGTSATLDIAWPPVQRWVEVDGLDAHASAQALDWDDERQNQLFDLGWDVRRYTARRIRRHPEAVVASVLRFLRG